MRPTIVQSLPVRSLQREEIATWLNFEGLELLRQIRQESNFEYHLLSTLGTTGIGLVTTIWGSDAMPVGSAWSIDARVTARAANNDGTDGRRDISALFSRQGGAAVQTGAATTLVSIGPHLVTFLASGSGVLLQVQDDGVHELNWSADIRVREVR
jgi:hypothetical protein